jgi:2-dehydro-3-deoxygluconokinase
MTALVDNPIGRLIEDLTLQGGVDLSLVRFVPFDGIGCQVTRWLHTGGIFTALGEHTPDAAIQAREVARHFGATVSYELNYRDSLWKGIGGKSKAIVVNRELVRYVDVLFGNEEEFSAALGFEVAGTSSDHSNLKIEPFQRMIEQVVREYPNVRTVTTTLRTAKSATSNGWGAPAYSQGKFYVVAQSVRASRAVYDCGVEIVDIVEITMTVPGALDVIVTLSAELSELVLVGAGTVLDADTACACIAIGARLLPNEREKLRKSMNGREPR